ncbi:MAG: oligosaccharide flippase family protein [Crocinitomicaceae bacterium]|nr:oligosaccharide flippase family protein [Crocinitomicaceae bacterium]
MQRKFIGNLILLVLLNLLVKPLAIFGIDAEVQNRIGAEEYGLYFSLFNFTYLFNIILDFGITNYNIKYVAQYPHLVKRYMGKIIPLRLLLFLIYVAVSVALALGLGYEGKQLTILGILIFNQFLISIVQFLRSYFAGLMLFKIDTILSVLDKVLLILIVGYLLYFSADKSNFELNWFIAAQTASFFFTFLFALIFILWKVGIPKLHWSPVFNWVIIKRSFPYALLILLMMLYTRVDAVMIERIHPNGKVETGIYAQAFRILDAFVMFGLLFTNLLFPIFSKLINDKLSIKPLLDSASRLLFTFALVTAIGGYFYASEILSLVYDSHIESSVAVFKTLMLTMIPLCMVMVYGTLLTANGSMRILNIFAMSGLVINLILNWFFIQLWGASGAATATLITQSIVAVTQLVFVWKYFALKFLPQLFFRYLTMLVLLLLTGYFLQLQFTNFSGLLIYLCVALVIALISGVIQPKVLLKSLKKSAE